jgi:hypothetical protein
MGRDACGTNAPTLPQAINSRFVYPCCSEKLVKIVTFDSGALPANVYRRGVSRFQKPRVGRSSQSVRGFASRRRLQRRHTHINLQLSTRAVQSSQGREISLQPHARRSRQDRSRNAGSDESDDIIPDSFREYKPKEILIASVYPISEPERSHRFYAGLWCQ